jgi:2-[(L-alanin-3-ylcarbamoyl)methyl]-2-hydroxybutanedioate decarboxylase
MNQEILKKSLEENQTPFYFYDYDEAIRNVSEMREILGEDAKICFAMKANPFLIKALEVHLDRIEVCSYGEFKICQHMGIDPEKLLISGVVKLPQDLQEILKTYGGSCAYTAESMKQFKMLQQWSEEYQVKLKVYPRLASNSQFGMDPEEVKEILRHKKDYLFLEIPGIHFFTGTQKRKSKIQQDELTMLQGFYQEMAEEGIGLSELEYGSGTKVDYFSEEKDHMVSNNVRELKEMIKETGFSGKITLEMGRAIAASCGYYLSRVRDVKRSNGRNYCLIDGGIHQLNYDGQLRGMYQPPMQIFPIEDDSEEKPEEDWVICGSLCTTNDIICNKYPMQMPQAGDAFAFAYTGAYSINEGLVLLLSHELPAAIAYSEDAGFETLRERTELWPVNTKDRKL